MTSSSGRARRGVKAHPTIAAKTEGPVLVYSRGSADRPAAPKAISMTQASSPWPLRGLLLLALGLFSCGIWWGLPGRWGWAGDELHPSSWPEAISTEAPANKHIWHLRYPPFHFAVLQGTSFPLRWLIDR